MGLMTGLKANKAYRLQKSGDTQGAIRLYEECYAEGLNDARYNLAYALLIIREGQYAKAKDFLVKHQKTPGMTQDQRVTLLVDYAACCLRLGDVDKGINTLEQQFRKTETGLIYQTLGYLYVEKYDQAHTPDFEQLRQEAARLAEEAESAPAEENEGAEDQDSGAMAPQEEKPEDGEGAEKPLTPEEAWTAGIEKAEAFIRKSVEYDDDDPICLDNMGQFLYRVKGDKAAAREWFDKAIARKENQIDTLYFLSRYDLDAGNRKAALEKLEKAKEGRFSPLNYCDRQTIEKEIAELKGEA